MRSVIAYCFLFMLTVILSAPVLAGADARALALFNESDSAHCYQGGKRLPPAQCVSTLTDEEKIAVIEDILHPTVQD